MNKGDRQKAIALVYTRYPRREDASVSDLKKELIRLGKEDPELREHLRPVLAQVTKTAAPRGTLQSMHAGFVDKVQQALDDLMRGSHVDSTRVHLQTNLSVISGVATLIYTHGSDPAGELRFRTSETPKSVAQKLKRALERS